MLYNMVIIFYNRIHEVSAVRSYCDIRYSPDTAECLDVHLPSAESFPVFVYFHGGGIEVGDKTDQLAVFEYLTKKGIAVVSVNYRMYPNAKFPEFIEDSAAAVAWVFQHIEEYGHAEKICVGGSSAGGYISMMLCFDKRYLGKHGISPSQIDAYIHDAGQPTMHFNVLRERGVDTRRVIVDETAPLYFIGADEQYPPMLIIVSDRDMENRYEQTMLVMSTLKHFGHTEPEVQLLVKNGTHDAYVNVLDENGVSEFGQMIETYIRSL